MIPSLTNKSSNQAWQKDLQTLQEKLLPTARAILKRIDAGNRVYLDEHDWFIWGQAFLFDPKLWKAPEEGKELQKLYREIEVELRGFSEGEEEKLSEFLRDRIGRVEEILETSSSRKPE